MGTTVMADAEAMAASVTATAAMAATPTPRVTVEASARRTAWATAAAAAMSVGFGQPCVGRRAFTSGPKVRSEGRAKLRVADCARRARTFDEHRCQRASISARTPAHSLVGARPSQLPLKTQRRKHQLSCQALGSQRPLLGVPASPLGQHVGISHSLCLRPDLCAIASCCLGINSDAGRLAFRRLGITIPCPRHQHSDA